MDQMFDIGEYGACSDDKTINTIAIQKAIDACHAAKGGRVFCGPGSFLTGTLELKSNVELHLAEGCRIKGSPCLDDYTPFVAKGYRSKWAPENASLNLIRAVNAENVSITGQGTFDGSGLAFYDTTSKEGKLGKPDTPRPRIGMFYQCRSFLIQDVTFVDSAFWTLWLMQCQNVNIQRISISSNRRMCSVDGIDVDACRNVTIRDCRFDTEDDCVAVRNMQELYEETAACENLIVKNCIMKSSCQGVRVGCPGDGVIRNCSFSKLDIESEVNGINFEFPHRYLPPAYTRRADVSNIRFSDVVIHCKNNPIKIIVEDGIALKALENLRFSDFRIQSVAPCLVQGCAETIIRDVEFINMQIQTSGEDAITCRYCENVKLTNVELSNRPESLNP